MKRFLLILSLFFSVCANAQIEKIVPPRPSPPKLVNDYTRSLTPAQVEALEHKLAAYDDSTSSQIAVVIIPTTGDYDIQEIALEIIRKWGVGSKEKSNGVVLLVAKDDRKVRIEVGYGLEGAVPDITAKHIIEEEITPSFKEGNYYRGLDKGTDAIIKAAAGEYKAPSNYGKKRRKFPWGTIVIIFIFIIFGLGGGGRGGGTYASRRGSKGVSTFPWWLLGGLGGGSGSGGGGWSGGGGGFGGFGGGGGGGGGASGSW